MQKPRELRAEIASALFLALLDGLDLSRLHVEDTTGMLVPVQ